MKVTWHTNACVIIESKKGARILCDPWFTAGAFLGSWFHWPPLPTGEADDIEESEFDAIYISHLHPDHFDRVFLARYLRRHPATRLVIAKFAHPWLREGVSRLAGGRHQVAEVGSFEDVWVGDIRVRIVVADVCDPRVCGSSIPCVPQAWRRGIDSVAIFDADGQTVCNANDALAVNHIPKLTKAIGRVDLLMGHYGGASPYPQCFPDVPDKHEAAQKVVDATTSTLATAAEALGARLLMPFAGQYVLGGRLVGLNDDRATVPLDQAAELVRTQTSAEVFTIEPSGSIDLGSGEKSPDYVEPTTTTRDKYLELISTATFSYESADLAEYDAIPIAELFEAAERIANRVRATSVDHGCSFVIGNGEASVTLNMDRDCDVVPGVSPRTENVTTITMPSGLLHQLTRRRRGYKGFTSVHWNQADVGSHFVWRRAGEYSQPAHAMLNFFGA
jgi:UDP-MurNAc hydroxylase